MRCAKKPITDSPRDSEESPNTHCQVMVTTEILYFPFKHSLTKLREVWNSRIKQLRQPRRAIKAGVFRVQTILNPFSHSNKDVYVHTHTLHTSSFCYKQDSKLMLSFFGLAVTDQEESTKKIIINTLRFG